MADKKKKAARGRGRPAIRLSSDECEKQRGQIVELARLMCTDAEIASVVGISEDTLKNAANREIFSELKCTGQMQGKISLRRWQFQAAQAGSTSMLTWLGRQYLDQTDRREVQLDTATSSWFKDEGERP